MAMLNNQMVYIYIYIWAFIARRSFSEIFHLVGGLEHEFYFPQ